MITPPLTLQHSHSYTHTPTPTLLHPSHSSTYTPTLTFHPSITLLHPLHSSTHTPILTLHPSHSSTHTPPPLTLLSHSSTPHPTLTLHHPPLTLLHLQALAPPPHGPVSTVPLPLSVSLPLGDDALPRSDRGPLGVLWARGSPALHIPCLPILDDCVPSSGCTQSVPYDVV